MGDEADRAGHHGKAAAHAPGELHLTCDRPDRARRVDRKVAAVSLRRLLGDQVHQLDMPTGETVLRGQCEEAGCAGIDLLVDGVAEARYDLFLGPVPSDDLARGLARMGSAWGFLQGARG